VSLLAVEGILLPIAVAGAFSTIPLAVVSVILLSERARRNGIAYLIGWAAGIFVITLGLSYGLGVIPPATGKSKDVFVAVIEIVLGLLLIVYGVFIFRRRPAAEAKENRWLTALDHAPTWSVLGTGLLLNLRPKALLLGVAAGVAVSRADLATGEIFIAIGIYTVITASTVAVPVIYMLIDPVRATRWLRTAKDFVAQHGRALTLIVCALIGVVLIGNGLTRF
jgi:hypothetical protein